MPPCMCATDIIILKMAILSLTMLSKYTQNASTVAHVQNISREL